MSGCLADTKRETAKTKPLQLDGQTAARVRQSFGVDPAQLEIGESDAVRAMGARAVAKGNVIQFAPGEFSPGTPEGLETLGHELAHVRSQAEGEAPMTGGLLEHPGLEAAADRAGEAFAAGSLSNTGPVDAGALSGRSAPAQCLWPWHRKEKRQLKRDIRGLKMGVNPIDLEAPESRTPEEAEMFELAENNQRLHDQVELEEKEARLAQLNRPNKLRRFFKGIGRGIDNIAMRSLPNRPQAPESLGVGPADPRIRIEQENRENYPWLYQDEGETAEITDVSRPMQKVPSYNPIPIVTPVAQAPAPELLGSHVPKPEIPQWSDGGRGFNPIPIVTEADRTPGYQFEPEPRAEQPAAPAPKKKRNRFARLFKGRS